MSDSQPSSESSPPPPHPASCSQPTTVTQRLLGAGASVAQSFTPLKQIHAHLCALHAYAHDVQRQVIAHHYCTHVSAEVHQCLLYDSDDAHARLVGVEYLISERLFLTLDDEEKPYWHSHKYEVESGMLVMPGLPELLERPMMKEIGGMYGKIICTWQTDRHALPIGPPTLMTSLTHEGAVDKALLQEKDRVTGIATEDRRKAREGHIDLPTGKPPLLDAWERGELISFAKKVRHERS